ncbi:hypothetical protein IM538_13170 [Cytobacillus suaedae]|nr:hypothetical protein IM538_13170 [Cytobacillus suaedae]
MTKQKKKRIVGFLKDILDEIVGSIIFAVAWKIIMFIPRMIIRLISNIW